MSTEPKAELKQPDPNDPAPANVADATPGGEGGDPFGSPDVEVSEQAHGIFGQRGSFIAEAFLAAHWGIARETLRDWRKKNVPPADLKKEGGQIAYSEDAVAMACAAFGVSASWRVETAETAPDAAASSTEAASEEPTYAVWRQVVNPRLILFREKNADGDFVGPELRLQVRDGGKFVPGMDLTGRVRLKEGHSDYYDLTCPHPMHRGRWPQKTAR